MSEYTFNVKEDFNISLFDFLKYKSGLSTRLFNKIKLYGEFFVNSKKVDIRIIIKQHDHIQVILEEDPGDTAPEEMNLDIIFEDDYLLAVNKPPNMVIHPTCYHHEGTLANGIAYYFKSKGLNIPVRPVIRLDKDTSGLVIVAKNALVQQTLIDSMKENRVNKTYIALVSGIPKPEQSIIDAPISRLPGSIITRQISTDGVKAVTHYKVNKIFENYSLVEVSPKTGRTHQIRVHMQYIGNPILGDTLYGTESELIERQALHAYKYEFPHPFFNEAISLTANLPEDISILINK